MIKKRSDSMILRQLRALKIELCLRVVLCLVVANLLFSVGEGLQLRPFTSLLPASVLTPAVWANSSTSPQAHHINPMEAPAVRKSDKRQSTPVEIPPVVVNLDSDERIANYPDDFGPSLDLASYSPPSGRAPPLDL